MYIYVCNICTMHVSVYILTNLYMYVCTYAYTEMMFISIYVLTYAYIYVHMFACMYACMHASTYKCIHICIICMYVYTVCTYIHNACVSIFMYLHTYVCTLVKIQCIVGASLSNVTTYILIAHKHVITKYMHVS